MPEHEVTLADVPEWSCGGYVYDDVLGIEFGSRVVMVDGVEVRQAVMMDPGPIHVTDDTPIARLRFIRREDCPEHGAVDA